MRTRGVLNSSHVLINAQKMNNNLLLLNSDSEYADALVKSLSTEPFNVVCLPSSQITETNCYQKFDVIVLNITQLKNDLELLKTIRKQSDVPLLLLTEYNENLDKIIGLEMGADDCIDKTCSSRELLARIRTILRRTQKIPIKHSRHHGVLMDCVQKQVMLNERKIALTKTEFNILDILIKSPGSAFSKKKLTELALGKKYTAYDRSIDVHISNLRNKLGKNQHGEPFIKTIRGFGYLVHISSNK